MEDYRSKVYGEFIYKDMPKIVISGRQTGKTVSLINDAHQTGGIVVCPTQIMADYVSKTARDLDMVIAKPIIYEQAMGNRGWLNHVPHYFDEFGFVLMHSILRTIHKFVYLNTKTIIIDESTISKLNQLFESLYICDIDGKRMKVKISLEKGEKE